MTESSWMRVSAVALRVQRQTGQNVPVRGYAAWEIAGYLLKYHNSLLLELERRRFEELVYHCDNCGASLCKERGYKRNHVNSAKRCWVFKPKDGGS